jgi:hypothetical protein
MTKTMKYMKNLTLSSLFGTYMSQASLLCLLRSACPTNACTQPTRSFCARYGFGAKTKRANAAM